MGHRWTACGSRPRRRERFGHRPAMTLQGGARVPVPRLRPARSLGPAVIAVIFEVWPAEGERQHYLDLAAALRSDLEGTDGFISVERFQSLADPGKLLSLSFWRDEEAVRAWRNQSPHRATQAKGRAGVFRDYRLRVAGVLRDYGMAERAERSEEHTSELQSRQYLVCRLLLEKKKMMAHSDYA